MKKVILSGLILCLIFFTSGCQTIINEPFVEKPYLGRGESTKIFFEVDNQREVTVATRLEVVLNETCFNKIAEKELGEIPPKQKTRTYVYLTQYSGQYENCKNNEYFINLILKDASGKKFHTSTVKVNLM